MIKNRKDNSIQEVLDNKVCCGCGACYAVCPKDSISIIFGDRYNYPEINNDTCTQCGICKKVCPSIYLTKDVDPDMKGVGLSNDYKYFLIHHNDDAIRLDAASGGFVTGIILHMIENGMADGGIVAKCSPDNFLESVSIIARDKKELLESRGSRYAPVSNCTPLKEILKDNGRYVFMGKPCEVDALERIIKLHPELGEKIVLKISFICAGTAARKSTKLFIERYMDDTNKVAKISYRGGGWPGFFRAFDKNGNIILKRDLIGDELDRLVPRDHMLRCDICLDQFGQFSDISVSDPWCQEFIDNETKGRTAIIVRSERALKYIKSALDKNDMTADEIKLDDILRYQDNVVQNSKKRKSWMAAYALFSLKKIRYPFSVIRYKGKGFKSVLRAIKNDHYFQSE